jgi:hypothetical protein
MSTQRHIDLGSMPSDDPRLERVSPSTIEVQLENPRTEDLFEAARQAFFGAKMVTVGARLFSTPLKPRHDPS